MTQNWGSKKHRVSYGCAMFFQLRRVLADALCFYWCAIIFCVFGLRQKFWEQDSLGIWTFHFFPTRISGRFPRNEWFFSKVGSFEKPAGFPPSFAQSGRHTSQVETTGERQASGGLKRAVSQSFWVGIFLKQKTGKQLNPWRIYGTDIYHNIPVPWIRHGLWKWESPQKVPKG